VEVGTFRGRFAKILCEGNPKLTLTCVDAWKAYAGYRDYTIQAELDAKFLEAQEKLAPYGATFIRAFSVDAATQFKDGSISFVYIDANHSYEGCTTDLMAWVPKVRPGGIVAGHDYRHFRRGLNIRVVEAVNGYTAAHDIDPWFLLGRNKVKPGEVRDRERSFFWVVE
jgi:predicted O-methyltransferase YrrM